MTDLEDLKLEENFTKHSEDKNSAIFYDEDNLICVLKAEYVPIENFKNLFNDLLELIKKNSFTKFIFDKRSLRTFHQPSMEWYYLEWKVEALKHGVSKHRKILPDLEWFVKAVEIAKRGLDDRLLPEVREQLEITYCNSLTEALDT